MILIIPVLSLMESGRLDIRRNERYAERFMRWHATAVPLVAGLYGAGRQLGARDRRALMGIWSAAGADRSVVVCSWDLPEVGRLLAGGWDVLYAPPAPVTGAALLSSLGADVGAVRLYGRPGGFTVEQGQPLPRARGYKLAKCSTDLLATVRRGVTPECELWHATARDPAASRAAGADGVVAACFAALPVPAPRNVEEISATARRLLVGLDVLPDREARIAALQRQLGSRLAGG